MQRSGELVAEILDEDFQTSDAETSIELNFAVLKFEHTVTLAFFFQSQASGSHRDAGAGVHRNRFRTNGRSTTQASPKLQGTQIGRDSMSPVVPEHI